MTTKPKPEILRAVNAKVAVWIRPEIFYAIEYDAEKSRFSPLWMAEHAEDRALIEVQSPASPLAFHGEHELINQVIACKSPVLIQHSPSEQNEDALAFWPGCPQPCAWLGIPLLIGEEAIGLLVVEHHKDLQAFGEDEQRMLEAIAQQTALALKNCDLNEQRRRRTHYMKLLNDVSQNLNSQTYRNEQDILEEIYRQAASLPVDTDNMYIALYEPSTDMVTFPLVYEKSKRVNTEADETWRPRRGGQGRTEWIIREKAPALTRTRQEVDEWYQQPEREGYLWREFASWMAAPMIYGNQVLGVISVYHRTEDYQYDQGDLEVLEILAKQAAAVLQNFRYFDQATKAEKLAMMIGISAEFMHRMNNLAGTIPARVQMLRLGLAAQNVSSPKIKRDLDAIDKDTKQILQAALLIRDASAAQKRERLIVSNLIRSALERNETARQRAGTEITVVEAFDPDLPCIYVDRDRFLAVLVNMVRNAFDAMPDGGQLKITTRVSFTVDHKACVEIEFTDNGVGISDTNLARIFDLFYSTKPGGTGFGLWRDRFVIKELGGDITVKSELGKGSTFTIQLPAA